jgi:hypothetical protein
MRRFKLLASALALLLFGFGAGLTYERMHLNRELRLARCQDALNMRQRAFSELLERGYSTFEARQQAERAVPTGRAPNNHCR